LGVVGRVPAYLSSSRQTPCSAGIGGLKQLGRLPSHRFTVLTVGGRLAVPLGHADVLSFLALLARAEVELDPLPLLQSAVARGLDRRVVVPIFALDEAEALLG
jgi:hypothetical protein